MFLIWLNKTYVLGVKLNLYSQNSVKDFFITSDL